jgi:hypothetical protein
MKTDPQNGKVITDYFLHNSLSSPETYLNDPYADEVQMCLPTFFQIMKLG